MCQPYKHSFSSVFKLKYSFELGQADITVGHLQLLCDAMSISISDFFKEEADNVEFAVAFSKLSPKQKTLLLTLLESL